MSTWVRRSQRFFGTGRAREHGPAESGLPRGSNQPKHGVWAAHQQHLDPLRQRHAGRDSVERGDYRIANCVRTSSGHRFSAPNGAAPRHLVANGRRGERHVAHLCGQSAHGRGDVHRRKSRAFGNEEDLPKAPQKPGKRLDFAVLRHLSNRLRGRDCDQTNCGSRDLLKVA
jgi:hypothetical protein